MMFDTEELNVFEDENARLLMERLMNRVEKLPIENRELKEENQRLRDENNRLKWEQGQPKNKGNLSKPPSIDHSFEAERKKTRPLHKRRKQAEIKIDREEAVKVDRETLPEDAQFKGYVDLIVQDIRITSDNVRFRKEKYRSATQKKSDVAALPEGYQGQFGQGIQALILELYFGIGTSEPTILEFLENVGVQISAEEISNGIIKKKERFHAAESEAVYLAGMASSP